jgi:hypothetical protein
MQEVPNTARNAPAYESIGPPDGFDKISDVIIERRNGRPAAQARRLERAIGDDGCNACG